MIEIEVARSGASVLKRDGKFLASTFNPVQEASAWAKKVHAALAPEDAAIIAGVGCGYHVAALKVLRPNCELLAIENDAGVAAEAFKFCPSLETKNVLVESDWLKLPDHARFRDVVCGVYGVAVHGPSLQIDPVYVSAVERLLHGRDKLSFLVLMKTRPELLAVLNPEAIGLIDDEAVSIKTLRRLFSTAGSSSRERRLWRVLEELVL